MKDRLRSLLSQFGFDTSDTLRDKNGHVIYCVFCKGHPRAPRMVPAVTLTQGDRVPRCGPCGRWRE